MPRRAVRRRGIVEWMQAHRITVLIALTGGCTSITTEVPLSELQAALHVRPGNPFVTLESPLGSVDGPCAVLPGGTTATLDGLAGEVRLGAGEDPHGEVHCLAPSASWANPPITTGPSTIVIDDGDTAWTFIIQQPFVPRTFELVAPGDGTLRSGDAATLRLAPDRGGLSNASVFARTGATGYFSIDETTGLVISGGDLQFTVPTVRDVTTTLTTIADLELVVERCDASLGCEAKGTISSMQPIVLAP